ncbi:MAG: hypothetical protein JXB05_28025 [Myxococcaceae bacterium]|nr:hypothetical protein [Myxococcaceae bacterium]
MDMERTGGVAVLIVLSFAVLSLAATGCASASVRSEREPGELPRLSRVFVVGQPGSRSRSEDITRLGELASSVMNKLLGRQIAATAHVIEPHEAGSPEALRQRIAEWKADGVLTLTVETVEGWVAAGGMGGVAAERTTTARVEALLTLAGSNQRVWSATCDYGRSGRSPQTVLDSCAEQLVEQLFKDGVLTAL